MWTSRWIRRGMALATLAVTGFDAPAAWSQSLGDVARRQEERRKQVTAGRTYTNADLGNVDAAPPAQPAAAAAPSEPPPAQEPATPEPAPRTNESGFIVEEDKATGKVNMKTAPGRPKRDEQYWRARAKDLRDRLAKVRANIAEAEQRLAAIDAAPQTPAIARERQTVAARLQQLQADLPLRNQDIAQLRTMAEGAKIPREWIEIDE